MKKKFRPNVYVKVFKLTNSYGYLTEDDFNKFKRAFEEKQGLYYNESISDYCFESFREVTKEIKRVANNAGLKAELIKTDYESYKDYIKIKGSNVREINFIVSLAKIYNKELRSTNFIITKIEAHSDFLIDNSPFRIINIDNDMMNCITVTYSYQKYKDGIGIDTIKGDFCHDKHLYRCFDNNHIVQ